ncbi:uncharacterized protein LOC115770870 [Drosophila novamexicana]|uniref:uncharacterized protein LOC115770870 n=1 Tax=Drosophila novamexicana TaxID=47314 RepID=UPI0011E5E77B|nr:uncharacterized protein LOC115770870 [Drosophila novamexicana]
MSPNQDQRILNVLLLAIICGTAIVAAHTNSIKPSFITDGSQGNVSGVPIPSRANPPAKLIRAKRVAIFNGQGVVKFVSGVAHPVKQVDKDQSFWFFYNFQNQYIPTTIPIYWWSFWNTTAFVSTARQLRKGMQATLHRDDTRSWVYDTIEAGMELLDGSERGASCLLRSICEISQLPFEDSNIFSEILNAVLIPTVDNVAEKYLNARDAGRGGADCLKTYSDCNQRVWNWLTHITKLSF